MYYKQPLLIDYFHEQNDRAQIYLFNRNGVVAVAKSMGFAGGKAGSQLTALLVSFLQGPLEQGDKDAIRTSVDDENTIFLCLVVPSGATGALHAAATFQVSPQNRVFLSWLVVSQEAQEHRLGSFFLVLMQELAGIAMPEESRRPNIYTQCREENQGALDFFKVRLGFRNIQPKGSLGFAGPTWIDDDKFIYLQSSNKVSIKECSPPSLADASIESLARMVRKRYPWVVGSTATPSLARWDGSAAWAECESSLQSNPWGYTPWSEYVQDDKVLFEKNREPNPMKASITWNEGVLLSLFPDHKGTSFKCMLPSSPEYDDPTDTSWRCLFGLFNGDACKNITSSAVVKMKRMTAYIWTLLCDLPDGHPYWPDLRIAVVLSLMPVMNEDIEQHNDQVHNGDLVGEKVALLFPERRELDLDAFSIDDCRVIMKQRVHRCLLRQWISPEPTEFEFAILARVAQVHLFTLSASSSPRLSNSDSKEIAWTMHLAERMLPESMQLQSSTPFWKVYMMAHFLGNQYRILVRPPDPPKNSKDDKLSFIDRFNLSTQSPNPLPGQSAQDEKVEKGSSLKTPPPAVGEGHIPEEAGIDSEGMVEFNLSTMSTNLLPGQSAQEEKGKIGSSLQTPPPAVVAGEDNEGTARNGCTQSPEPEGDHGQNNRANIDLEHTWERLQREGVIVVPPSTDGIKMSDWLVGCKGGRSTPKKKKRKKMKPFPPIPPPPSLPSTGRWSWRPHRVLQFDTHDLPGLCPIGEVDLSFLARMLDRDDIAVVSVGLLGELDVQGWSARALLAEIGFARHDMNLVYEKSEDGSITEKQTIKLTGHEIGKYWHERYAEQGRGAGKQPYRVGDAGIVLNPNEEIYVYDVKTSSLCPRLDFDFLNHFKLAELRPGGPWCSMNCVSWLSFQRTKFAPQTPILLTVIYRLHCCHRSLPPRCQKWEA